MRKYYNNVQDSNGEPIDGATVTVKIQSSGANATIYEDNESTTKTNPITVVAATGAFNFKVANGEYILEIYKAGDATFDPAVAFNHIIIEDPKDAVDAEDGQYKRLLLIDTSEVVNAIGDFGGGSQNIDCEAGNVATCTISTAACTLVLTNPPATGTFGSVLVGMTNGGSQTVTITNGDYEGGSAPTWTTAGLDWFIMWTIDAGTIVHVAPISLDSK